MTSKKTQKIALTIVLCALSLALLFLSTFIFGRIYAEESQYDQNNAIANSGQSDVQIAYNKDKDDPIFYMDNYNSDELSNVKYISNKNYFFANPKHAEQVDGYNDDYGTCTTVAAQLLLGYHNYYSDRRLIPIYGNNNKRFLSEDYGKIELSPLFHWSADSGYGKASIGTEDEVYEELYRLTPTSSLPALSQSVSNVTTGTKKFIEKYAPTIKDKIFLQAQVFSDEEAHAEIDADRPIIICNNPLGTSANTFHVMVAYGYATVKGTPGYIVHRGFLEDSVHCWVPTSWLGFQIKMRVNHNHTYTDVGNNLLDRDKNLTYREIKCSECGCNTVDDLYTVENDKITAVNYPVSGELILPEKVQGRYISKISANVFAGQAITSVAFPQYVTEIGAGAFKNCTELTTLTTATGYSWATALDYVNKIGDQAFFGCNLQGSLHIPKSVYQIGYGAFAGCIDLDITAAESNQYFAAENNVLYGNRLTFDENHNITSKTEKVLVIHAGNVMKDIILPESVEEIGDYAFAGNTHIQSVRARREVGVGDCAFANCPNLLSVDFDGIDVDMAGNYIFENCLPEFVIYVPYKYQFNYKNAFAMYMERVQSRQLHINLFPDNSVEYRTVYVGADIDIFYTPEKTGYVFDGWYDNPEFNGNAYTNGGEWKIDDSVTYYAKWTPKTYTVTLDPDGGTMTGGNTFTVMYGSSFSIDTTVNKDYHVFQGWFYNETERYITENGVGTVKWDIDGDVTLKAVWTPYAYEVKIKDGTWKWLGEYGVSEHECLIEYGTTIPNDQVFDYFRDIEKYFKIGQYFSYFTDIKGNILAWETIPALGANGETVVIVPHWEKEEYNINFVTKCDLVVAAQKHTYGNPIALPVLSRVGYIFLGWSTEENGTAEGYVTVPDLTPDAQTVGAEVSLYAQWQIITYSIVYNANGGAGFMANTSCEYGTTYKLRANTFTKTGYTFVGWSKSPSGSVEYSDGQEIRNLTSVGGEEINLYAVWNEIKYDIVYKNLADGMKVNKLYYTYEEGIPTMPKLYTRGSNGRDIEFKTFLGWYTSLDFSQKVTSVPAKTRTGVLTLYAKYDYFLLKQYDNGQTYSVTSNAGVNPCIDVDIYLGSVYYNKVKDTSLSKIRIEFSLKHSGFCNAKSIFLYDESQSMIRNIWSTTITEIGDGTYNGVIELDLKTYKNTDKFTLRFISAKMFYWQFSNFELTVNLTN